MKGSSETTAVDQDQISQDWQSRGFSCDLWVDPPGQVWANFVHNTDELVMVVKGDVQFEISDKTYRPSPGDELLIPAGVNHTVRNLGNTRSGWLYGYKQRSST